MTQTVDGASKSFRAKCLYVHPNVAEFHFSKFPCLDIPHHMTNTQQICRKDSLFFQCSHLSSHIILISSIKRKSFLSCFYLKPCISFQGTFHNHCSHLSLNFPQTLMLRDPQITRDVLGGTSSLTTTELHPNTLVVTVQWHHSSNQEDNNIVCFSSKWFLPRP